MKEILSQGIKAITEMPVLMKLGMAFSLGLCLIIPMFCIGMLALASGAASYSVNGQPVSKLEFYTGLSYLFAAIGAYLIPLGVIVVGMWYQRNWVREVMIAFLIITMFIPVVQPYLRDGNLIALPALSFVFDTVVLIFAAWYLYVKRTVVQYFESVQERRSLTGR